MSEEKTEQKKTALEKVQALDMASLDNKKLGDVLIFLIDRKDAIDLRSKDYGAAIEVVRDEFLKRLREQKAKSFNIEGVGLITQKETTRFGSKDWAATYQWLWETAKKAADRKQETGEGDPAEAFSWLGKTISSELCKQMLSSEGTLPDGVEKTSQITLSFTRKEAK